jgi:hypothetical protein
VIKDMITPQVLIEILPFSPFPDSFVAKMACGSSPCCESRSRIFATKLSGNGENGRISMSTCAVAKIQDITAGANLKNAKAARETAGVQHDAAAAAVAQNAVLVT